MRLLLWCKINLPVHTVAEIDSTTSTRPSVRARPPGTTTVTETSSIQGRLTSDGPDSRLAAAAQSDDRRDASPITIGAKHDGVEIGNTGRLVGHDVKRRPQHHRHSVSIAAPPNWRRSMRRAGFWPAGTFDRVGLPAERLSCWNLPAGHINNNDRCRAPCSASTVTATRGCGFDGTNDEQRAARLCERCRGLSPGEWRGGDDERRVERHRKRGGSASMVELSTSAAQRAAAAL